MATTVKNAFIDFNNNSVNLIPEKTKKARDSRDWLFKQIENLPNKICDFPKLYENKHIRFGSFARNTKIKPLDDIDLIIAFSAEGCTYSTKEYGRYYIINVPERAELLRKLCNDDCTLNSRKLINKMVSSLALVEHYKKAEIHRRSEAATLQLLSYEWNFDIVPAFYTDTGYYLMPDGNGNWMATDPRVDQNRIKEINQRHNGKVNQIVRTLKYWNKRPTMPTILPYLFENIILNYFDSQASIYNYIDYNLRDFWEHLSLAIYFEVNDPKGFQGNLNDLTNEEKLNISIKAKEAFNKAVEAINFEVKEYNNEKSINKWREIFGSEYPKFE